MLQNKLQQAQYKLHAKENSQNIIKYPQYKVTLMFEWKHHDVLINVI